ncbi:MAG: aldo/keto reductase [Calditrichaeota bacterium]|nr:MAG: aldo/keto reductase [Calditrichota bacterium]
MEINRQFKPRRELGRTGFMATQLGIGDVADRKIPRETLVSTLCRALDAGLNVIDTAPGYEDGYSEEIVAQAVQGRRDSLFIIDKIDFLDQPVMPQIESSLRRLKLEYADAFVFHGLSSLELLEQLLQPESGFDQLAAAVRQGKARFIGISSHHPDVLQAALTIDRCDVLMFPVGAFVDDRYVQDILPAAREKRAATIGFKTFAAGKLLGDTFGYNQPLMNRPRGKVSSGGNKDVRFVLPTLTVAECLHYTLTCDPDVALLGMSFPNEQDEAFSAAHSFRPLSAADMDRIRRLAAAAVRHKGPCWWNPDAGV